MRERRSTSLMRDVAAAFDRFLARSAGDSPIILAGHSQGALHLERLINEKVAGEPIAKRVVAAYVVGWPISVVATCLSLGLPACTAPDQAGCILSWMSFGEPANPDFMLRPVAKTKGLTGGERRREDMLCVNPITGVAERRGAARRQSRHAGADRGPAVGGASARHGRRRIATRAC